MIALPTCRFPLAMWLLETWEPRSRHGWTAQEYYEVEVTWRLWVKGIPKP